MAKNSPGCLLSVNFRQVDIYVIFLLLCQNAMAQTAQGTVCFDLQVPVVQLPMMGGKAGWQEQGAVDHVASAFRKQLTLVFEIGSLTGLQCVKWTVWPVRPIDLPITTSSALGIQASVSTPRFLHGIGFEGLMMA